jgi:hypothetical protein
MTPSMRELIAAAAGEWVCPMHRDRCEDAVCTSRQADLVRVVSDLVREAVRRAFNATGYALTGDMRLMDLGELQASVVAAVMGDEQP